MDDLLSYDVIDDCSDYRRMDQQDQYESQGLDDSMEDERDLNQIIADRRAAEIELDAREAHVFNSRIPELLREQGPLQNSTLLDQFPPFPQFFRIVLFVMF